jgi:hypothetical protein
MKCTFSKLILNFYVLYVFRTRWFIFRKKVLWGNGMERFTCIGMGGAYKTAVTNVCKTCHTITAYTTASGSKQVEVIKIKKNEIIF